MVRVTSAFRSVSLSAKKQPPVNDRRLHLLAALSDYSVFSSSLPPRAALGTRGWISGPRDPPTPPFNSAGGALGGEGGEGGEGGP